MVMYRPRWECALLFRSTRKWSECQKLLDKENSTFQAAIHIKKLIFSWESLWCSWDSNLWTYRDSCKVDLKPSTCSSKVKNKPYHYLLWRYGTTDPRTVTSRGSWSSSPPCHNAIVGVDLRPLFKVGLPFLVLNSPGHLVITSWTSSRQVKNYVLFEYPWKRGEYCKSFHGNIRGLQTKRRIAPCLTTSLAFPRHQQHFTSFVILIAKHLELYRWIDRDHWMNSQFLALRADDNSHPW